jgi:hypothetical protein
MTIRIDSSYIRSLDFDSAARRLVVVFQDGAKIIYSQVHPKTYQAILTADSHGEKFHELMAGKKFTVVKKAA